MGICPPTLTSTDRNGSKRCTIGAVNGVRSLTEARVVENKLPSPPFFYSFYSSSSDFALFLRVCPIYSRTEKDETINNSDSALA